jgi:prepilin-type N-terminal cleavage/methylation domain-containing protein/prepilin-type processing-associated H-X9-DG protein
MKKKMGFTLIELLVVVAIIAVLVAILLPALQKARDAAVQAQCAANFHQIGIGMASYVDDNNGFVPYCYNVYDPRAISDWEKPIGFGLLQKYFPGSNLWHISGDNDGSARGLFHCPRPAGKTIEYGNFASISYLGYYQPSYKTDMLISGTALGTGWMNGNPWASYLYGVGNHGGQGGNVLYLDGHVRWWLSGDIAVRSTRNGWVPGGGIVQAAFNE